MLVGAFVRKNTLYCSVNTLVKHANTSKKQQFSSECCNALCGKVIQIHNTVTTHTVTHYANPPCTPTKKKERYGPGLSLLEYLEKVDEDFLSAKGQHVPLLEDGQWMVLVYAVYLYFYLFVHFVYLDVLFLGYIIA